MLSLISTRHARASARVAADTRDAAPRSPRMRSSARRTAPADWTARATHYFDAAWHSSQTLRRLLKANLDDEALGLRKPPALLTGTMEAMLNSICPGLPDDVDSLRYFQQLLQLHLSALTAAELAQLGRLLKTLRFDHVVVESVIDDVMVAEHGFANGPPHCRQRTLMFSKDLYCALDEATQSAADAEAISARERLLTPSQAQQARDALAALSGRDDRGVTLTELASAANQLAQATGAPIKTSVAVAAFPLPPASSVSWQDGQLIIELHTLAALNETTNRWLHASLLRDMLELLLMHKLFDPSATLMSLSAAQRALLQREVEHVLSLPPTPADPALAARAAEVLARSVSFGTMQIYPTAGAMLGHAWISPVLSVVPDKSRKGIEAGKRYMRAGLRTEPAHCTVNEWDILWLSQQDNDKLYPAEQAWHLSVPVHWLKLQQAAEDTRKEWQHKRLPYRFIGTEPGMPPTGCRATVWHALQRAMDDDTRTLFGHFCRGLPDPESPTELALRTGQFMQWLHRLAQRPIGERSDL